MLLITKCVEQLCRLFSSHGCHGIGVQHILMFNMQQIYSYIRADEWLPALQTTPAPSGNYPDECVKWSANPQSPLVTSITQLEQALTDALLLGWFGMVSVWSTCVGGCGLVKLSWECPSARRQLRASWRARGLPMLQQRDGFSESHWHPPQTVISLQFCCFERF